VKIVVLDGYTLNPGDLSWDALNEFGELLIYERTPEHLIRERIQDAQIVLTNKTPLTKEVLEAQSSIQMVGVLATGYNVVDTQTASDMGIVVCNVPTYGTDAVAQYVFALLLGLIHRVELHDHSVKAGEWANSQDFCYWKSPLMELSGKIFGVVGLGRIGRRTAEIAMAFGMKVIAYDSFAGIQKENDPIKFVTLDTVFREADVLSLHVPLFESTFQLVNAPRLSSMKKGAYLINTSRGQLIDESALYHALESGHLAGAAVDVVSTEPISHDNVLLNAPNMIITPHIAWAPIEARERLLSVVIENISNFIAGTPINVVT